MTQATSGSGVVIFACPHGIGKSRMAAALFQATAADAGLADWTTTTAAGEDPGDGLSPHAARLLAGSAAEPFLEPGPGRHLAQVVELVTRKRVLTVGIDMDDSPARLDHAWRLVSTEPGPAMRDEIDRLVTELIGSLASSARSSSQPEPETE